MCSSGRPIGTGVWWFHQNTTRGINIVLEHWKGTGGNIIIDNLTDKEINIESIFVINNSIEAKPFSSSQSSIDPKGKQSVSISEFVAVNPGQKVEESDEKAKDANYYKHKMKSGENIGWTANIQNGNYDTMNSFSINFNY